MARAVQATLIVVAILSLGLATTFYAITAPYRELNAWGQGVISQLEVSKSKPPPGVDVARWDCVLGWTQNAFPNVFYTPDYIVDKPRFSEFKTQLADRLKRDVDVETIVWIWDQLALLGKNGADYGQKFRSVPPYGKIHLDENNEPFDNVRIRIIVSSD